MTLMGFKDFVCLSYPTVKCYLKLLSGKLISQIKRQLDVKYDEHLVWHNTGRRAATSNIASLTSSVISFSSLTPTISAGLLSLLEV